MRFRRPSRPPPSDSISRASSNASTGVATPVRERPTSSSISASACAPRRRSSVASGSAADHEVERDGQRHLRRHRGSAGHLLDTDHRIVEDQRHPEFAREDRGLLGRRHRQARRPRIALAAPRSQPSCGSSGGERAPARARLRSRQPARGCARADRGLRPVPGSRARSL